MYQVYIFLNIDEKRNKKMSFTPHPTILPFLPHPMSSYFLCPSAPFIFLHHCYALVLLCSPAYACLLTSQLHYTPLACALPLPHSSLSSLLKNTLCCSDSKKPH